jgi:putative hydrolase of the HAD superfamily
MLSYGPFFALAGFAVRDTARARGWTRLAISGEFGIGKPEPSIFEHTLSLLGSDREHAVMVGDSLARDVDGAIAAGLRAVWVNRSGSSRAEDRPGLVEITTLSDLPRALPPLPS